MPRVDLRAEKIGAKIRDAQLEKIPAMLVVGAKEAESETVSFRDRIDGDQGAMPLSQAIERLAAERDSRHSRQTAPPPAPAVADSDAAEDHTY